MKKKIFILVGLFLLFMVVLTPAKLIESFLPQQNLLAVSGFSGSVWSGEISHINAQQISLKDVSFSINPIALLMAKLSVKLDIPKGDINGDLNVKMGSDYQKNIEFSDVNLSVQAAVLKSFIPIKDSEVGGVLESEALNLIVENKKILAVDGLGSWKNASVTYSGENWALGDFSVQLSTDDKKVIQGKLLKTKNALGLEGSFSLTTAGVFEMIGSISTESEQRLYQTFALFNNGKPANGRLPIKFKQKIF